MMSLVFVCVKYVEHNPPGRNIKSLSLDPRFISAARSSSFLPWGVVLTYLPAPGGGGGLMFMFYVPVFGRL